MVIPSEVEKSPCETLKAIPRDPSTPLRSAQDDFELSVIDPINFPGSLRFVTLNQFPSLQLQIPLCAGPRFFVPPVSRNQKRTALLDDFAANICAADVDRPVFIQ